MLSPVEEAAVTLAQWTREALDQIRRRVAAEQHGEVFNQPLTIADEGAGHDV